MSVPVFQLNLERNERIFHSEFERLIELHKNDKVKSSLKSEFARFSPPSIVDSYGDTLLHLGAKYNNYKLIDFLVKSGCDIDAKNLLEETPVFNALSFVRLEAIETLMNANADFWTNGADRVLQLLIDKKDILATSILVAFMQKLKSYCEDLGKMSALLINMNCPLMFVVYVSDPSLLQMILETADYEIDNKEAFVALQYVMKIADFENLRVLCQSKRLVQPRYRLFSQVEFSCTCVHWKYMKPLFKRLTDWMILDKIFLYYLNRMLTSVDKCDIQILLLEYNIDKQLMQKYQLNVLPIIFGNYRLNLDYLTEIARKSLLNIDDKDVEGLGALHYAVMDNSINTVRLLIELGADCNIKDDDGRTPLIYAYHVKCIELLLQSGADLQIANNGMSMLEMWLSNSDVTKVLLAQHAIGQFQGVQTKRPILEEINYEPIYKNYYEKCLKQVEDMVSHEVFSSLTLFDIITGKPKNISKFIKSRETITTIMEWCSRNCLNSYYCSSLELKLEKAYNLYRMKCRVAMIISKSISSRPISYDHLVVDRICDFLYSKYKDILVFLSA